LLLVCEFCEAWYCLMAEEEESIRLLDVWIIRFVGTGAPFRLDACCVLLPVNMLVLTLPDSRLLGWLPVLYCICVALAVTWLAINVDKKVS